MSVTPPSSPGLVVALAGLLGLVAFGPTVVAQAPQARNAAGGEVRLVPIQGNVSMLVGAGANITVQAGEDGILLVDTGVAELSEKVLDAIWPLSKKPLVYIINTSDQADHVGGNEKIGNAGRPVSTVGQVRMFYRNDWLRQLKDCNAPADPSLSAPGVYIIAFSTVLERMSAPAGTAAPTPEAAWPNDTYSETQKNLYFYGEAVQVFHQPGNTGRQQHRHVPAIRCDQRGRSGRSHLLSRDRRRERRQHPGCDRRIEPAEADGRSCGLTRKGER